MASAGEFKDKKKKNSKEKITDYKHKCKTKIHYVTVSSYKFKSIRFTKFTHFARRLSFNLIYIFYSATTAPAAAGAFFFYEKWKNKCHIQMVFFLFCVRLFGTANGFIYQYFCFSSFENLTVCFRLKKYKNRCLNKIDLQLNIEERQ